MVFAGGFQAMSARSQPFVDPSWLKSRLTDPAIVIIDLRREDEYLQRHIPGAVWSPYGEGSWYFRPAMGAPTPGVRNALAERMGQLGASAQSHVILVHAGRIYNHPALAAQVYWTFKYAGHSKVSILHNGIRAFLKEPGIKVTNVSRPIRPTTYSTDPGSPTLAVAEDVREAIKQKSQIIDVRARGQFLGINKIAEVVRYGTITSAVYFPAAGLATDGGGGIRPMGELKQLFTAMKIDP
jgi:thiosulfate/3-mercaptopyruvate sulfurtransferase